MTMTKKKAVVSTLREYQANFLMSPAGLARLAKTLFTRNVLNIAHDDGAHSRRLRSNTSNGNP